MNTGPPDADGEDAEVGDALDGGPEEVTGLDGEVEFDDDTPSTALPPKLEAWRRRSATGAILTGFALGLQQVLEPKRQEPSIMMETSGDPPRDLPVEADFEYRRPRQSVVNIRPWLLDSERADTPTGEPIDSAPGTQPDGDADDDQDQT